MKYRYMASWLAEEKVVVNFEDIPKEPVWKFWDGKLKSGEKPPKRVRILLTGLVYNWEDFQKIRKKK